MDAAGDPPAAMGGSSGPLLRSGYVVDGCDKGAEEPGKDEGLKHAQASLPPGHVPSHKRFNIDPVHEGVEERDDCSSGQDEHDYDAAKVDKGAGGSKRKPEAADAETIHE
jgi:hypothetical protein